MATDTRNRFRSALSRERGTADRMGGAYEERAEGFDAYDAASRQNEATLGRFFEQYGDDFADLRGSQVGMGRIRTGYGGEDEGRLERRFMDRASSALAQNSLQASGQNLQNIQGMGAYGQAAQGRYLDLLSGERDREMMEQNARRNRRSSLWGAAAGVAGMALGGPIGGAIGTAIGNKFGGGG